MARVNPACPDGRHPRPHDRRARRRRQGQRPGPPRAAEATVVVDDPRDGRGPVQGIAAGLAALDGLADAAFISSTDMPFLHPAFIRRVLRVLDEREETDVALPVARGYPQPLAAAYRVRLAPRAERLVKEDRLRPAFLFDECAVERLDDAALKADALIAALDPDLDSVLNVNTQADYQDARARPAPAVTVQLFGALARADSGRGPRSVRAATVDEAADATGLTFDRHVTARTGGGGGRGGGGGGRGGRRAGGGAARGPARRLSRGAGGAAGRPAAGRRAVRGGRGPRARRRASATPACRAPTDPENLLVSASAGRFIERVRRDAAAGERRPCPAPRRSPGARPASRPCAVTARPRRCTARPSTLPGARHCASGRAQLLYGSGYAAQAPVEARQQLQAAFPSRAMARSASPSAPGWSWPRPAGCPQATPETRNDLTRSARSPAASRGRPTRRSPRNCSSAQHVDYHLRKVPQAGCNSRRHLARFLSEPPGCAVRRARVP